jgi:hypothetical protein
MIDAMFPNNPDIKGDLWEAYLPCKEGVATKDGDENFPRKRYLPYAALSTIALMIENVIGLSISLPRKTVDWIIPNLEIMGIENLALKRNLITILSNKSQRGWEIQMESEKLYYFTINILGQKKKTLPIPSGKCSMLIDKLPSDHYEMLKFYISFWKEWKTVLLEGKLTATNPESEYSLVCSRLDDTEIYTAYSDTVIPVTAKKTIAVNATVGNTLIIKNALDKNYRVLNCMGQEIANGVLSANLQEIEVPTAGIAFVD